MRILLTGCNGYIGSVLTPMLLTRGHEVLGIDSDFFESCVFQEPATGFVHRTMDIRDVERADLDGVEAVIHLAALSNDPLGNLDPGLTLSINHAASVRLARLAKEAGVRRFVFSSSCSTYGASGDDLINEEGELNPVTPYGRSKAAVDRDVAALADDRFSPTFLRHATAYGVSPRMRLDIVLNELVALAYTTGRIVMKSDGTPWRPLVHVEDISRTFLSVLDAPRRKIHNEAFNVGVTSENYRIGELAEIVRQTVPGSRVEYARGAGPDKRCYRVDCGKLARTLPGLQMRWDARRGARQLYEAYRSAGLTEDEVLGPRYRRLDTLQQLLDSGAIDTQLRRPHDRTAADVCRADQSTAGQPGRATAAVQGN